MIILLNGTSSSGKSSLANALRESLPEPYFLFGIDDFLEKSMPTDLSRRFGVSSCSGCHCPPHSLYADRSRFTVTRLVRWNGTGVRWTPHLCGASQSFAEHPWSKRSLTPWPKTRDRPRIIRDRLQLALWSIGQYWAINPRRLCPTDSEKPEHWHRTQNPRHKTVTWKT